MSLAAAPPHPARLASVQALRGVASVAVVLSHSARHVNKAFAAPGLITLFQAGHAGVDLFFAISGFIILFVHHRDIGRPARLGRYAGRRFSRVLPLYWVALLITIAMGVAGGHAIPFAPAFVQSALLLPSLDPPLLGIAWTLQFEVVFYAVFAVLIASEAAGAAAMAAWFAWIALTACGLASRGIPAALCGVYGIEFLMGMAAAHAVLSGSVKRPVVVALSGLCCFVIAMALESARIVDGYADYARLIYGPASALAIAGLAAHEQSGALRVPDWLQRLGAASYSIYLFQFVFIGLVWQACVACGLAEPRFRVSCFLMLAASAVLGGIVVSRTLEQPLLAWMRGRRFARSASASRPAL